MIIIVMKEYCVVQPKNISVILQIKIYYEEKVLLQTYLPYGHVTTKHSSCSVYEFLLWKK